MKEKQRVNWLSRGIFTLDKRELGVFFGDIDYFLLLTWCCLLFICRQPAYLCYLHFDNDRREAYIWLAEEVIWCLCRISSCYSGNWPVDLFFYALMLTPRGGEAGFQYFLMVNGSARLWAAC